MNSEKNDFREQAEARIVALLLGEASPFEEAAVQDLVKQDAGLAAFYEEMKKVLSLVQAASAKGGEAKEAVPRHSGSRMRGVSSSCGSSPNRYGLKRRSCGSRYGIGAGSYPSLWPPAW